MKLKGRDQSWLEFNERLLHEAADRKVPLMERLKFLSIYSSNLDEFSRVRIPTVIALGKLKKQPASDEAAKILDIINAQQQQFGRIIESIRQDLIPKHICLVYNDPIPDFILEEVKRFFYTQIAGLLRIVFPQHQDDFFPQNNHIYLTAVFQDPTGSKLAVLAIPSDHMPRFFSLEKQGRQFIVFIDDIIKRHLPQLWPGITMDAVYSFKVTRDAELDLEDEFKGNLARKIAQQIAKRDFGLVTRLLYDADMPAGLLQQLVHHLGLAHAMIVPGGRYHNLKDLAAIPVHDKSLSDKPWTSSLYPIDQDGLLATLTRQDILLHLPFHSYDTVLRFFNEVALDRTVTEICMTMYRISGTSKIAEALITAALSGKSVTVFMELKARFDEANNINWSKKMKAAGIRIIYSIPKMKVHAKIVLVKRKLKGKPQWLGLLGTGNFNEVTAAFYTDQVLMTSNTALLKDLDQLFRLLKARKKALPADGIQPQHLLIAPFNLQTGFTALIDREIRIARSGHKGALIIKLNNLEDEKMISKLYEASNAGVDIQLIVRGICRLVPGIPGQSTGIRITRIVDRYLEHGRIFWFRNKGAHEVYLGSADWMTRNLVRRVEVCFPVLDPSLKKSLYQVLNIYLKDNVKASRIRADGKYHPVAPKSKKWQAQAVMNNWVQDAVEEHNK